jgi:hypothetical protein
LAAIAAEASAVGGRPVPGVIHSAFIVIDSIATDELSESVYQAVEKRHLGLPCGVLAVLKS